MQEVDSRTATSCWTSRTLRSRGTLRSCRPRRTLLDFDHTLRVSGSIRIGAEALEDAAKRSSGRLMTEPFPNICPQCLVLLSHLRGGLSPCALLRMQSINSAGVPLWTSLARASASQLVSECSHAIRFCSRSAAVACRKFHNFRPIGRFSSPAQETSETV